jgi:phosphoribosylglycinamide formyltransferase 2
MERLRTSQGVKRSTSIPKLKRRLLRGEGQAPGCRGARQPSALGGTGGVAPGCQRGGPIPGKAASMPPPTGPTPPSRDHLSACVSCTPQRPGPPPGPPPPAPSRQRPPRSPPSAGMLTSGDGRAPRACDGANTRLHTQCGGTGAWLMSVWLEVECGAERRERRSELWKRLRS